MKLVRVNMSTKTIAVEDMPQEYAGLGGRGLTSIMINAEVPPKCDPPVTPMRFASIYGFWETKSVQAMRSS